MGGLATLLNQGLQPRDIRGMVFFFCREISDQGTLSHKLTGGGGGGELLT